MSESPGDRDEGTNENPTQDSEKETKEPEKMTIIVESLFNTALNLSISTTATVRDLKRRIREGDNTRIPISRQEIIYNKKPIHDSKRLSEYGIGNGSTVRLLPRIRSGIRDIKPEEDYSEQGIMPGAPFTLGSVGVSAAILIPYENGHQGHLISDGQDMNSETNLLRMKSESELSSATKRKREKENEQTKKRVEAVRKMLEERRRKVEERKRVPGILRPTSNGKKEDSGNAHTMEELSTSEMDWTAESETERTESDTELRLTETEQRDAEAETKPTSHFILVRRRTNMEEKCDYCGKLRLSTRFFKCLCEKKLCFQHRKPECHDCPNSPDSHNTDKERTEDSGQKQPY